MYATIVIPALNEEASIGPLLTEIIHASRNLPVREIIVVDDGSSDLTAKHAIAAAGDSDMLRIIRHGKRQGQSRALLTGIRAASHDLILTLDADGQNDPADFVKLFSEYVSRQAQSTRMLIAGQRKRRRDSLLRLISSRVANNVRRTMLNDSVRDTGCSLKLFRKQDFLELPFFDHIHRFLPALMKSTGVKVVLVDVSHRARTAGLSKYGVWDRLWVGIHDLVGVRWLMKRQVTNVELEDLL